MDNYVAGQSTPPQAETDLPLGRARIPANWALQLVLFLATCVCVQRAASHPLTLTYPSVFSHLAELPKFSSGG